jgi:hypothetical protein
VGGVGGGVCEGVERGEGVGKKNVTVKGRNSGVTRRSPSIMLPINNPSPFC